ncbi:helix-turn-helix transcriptional regulator [Streptomyces sp. NPDC038707]|uniref:Bacterial conjugation repressor FinO n=1 Tax=Streptomyces achromogenes subsp. streptozoticus TaxID=285532 RepID=A0A898JTF4_STRC2|nr:bacterial conjugation repressor FinO [Streptomyces achromogenes subsp. streptozoticus]
MVNAVENMLAYAAMSELSAEEDERVRFGPMPRGQDIGEDLLLGVYDHVLSYHAATTLEIATALGVSSAAVRDAMRELLRLKLVRHCKEQDTFLASDPDAAQTELVLPLESAIHEKQRELIAIHHQMERFSKSFKRHQRTQRKSRLVATLENQREISLRLTDSIRRSSGEILTMWPVCSYETQILEDTLRLSYDAVPRGVRLRTLYPHSARHHPSFRANLQQNLESGAEVRTSDEVQHFIIIVDRETAFLPTDSSKGGTSAVTVVYEPAIVNVLCGIYRNTWQSACVFDGSTPNDTSLNNVRNAILKMLACGLKDDVIARRVGISSRTLRRHIAAIMEELGAESRFQAGAAAASAGLIGTPVGR